MVLLIYENMFISKAIQLIGESREIAIIDVNKTGNAIHVPANDLDLSEFTFRNIAIPGEDGCSCDRVKPSPNRSTETICSVGIFAE